MPTCSLNCLAVAGVLAVSAALGMSTFSCTSSVVHEFVASPLQTSLKGVA